VEPGEPKTEAFEVTPPDQSPTAWETARPRYFGVTPHGVAAVLAAFAFGAGVAGLTGTLFASLQTGVYSSDFDTPILITIYAMVILGGGGSLLGVVIGAFTVNILLEVLRTPDHARSGAGALVSTR